MFGCTDITQLELFEYTDITQLELFECTNITQLELKSQVRDCFLPVTVFVPVHTSSSMGLVQSKNLFGSSWCNTKSNGMEAHCTNNNLKDGRKTNREGRSRACLTTHDLQFTCLASLSCFDRLRGEHSL
eukprot:scaffold78635_cov19-Tisochrysis_lutea.AAC.1